MSSFPNKFSRSCLTVALAIGLSGCFFFKKKHAGSAVEETAEAVLGKSLGQKALGPDYDELESIYGLVSEHPPAAIRTDPDTYARQMLLQFREEGTVVARAIGQIEPYRILLGGASTDFSKPPQETYDATSLLAAMAVADIICQALVAPNSTDHPGWDTILPQPPSRVESNITYLAQRILGIHSSDISGETIDAMIDIFDTANSDGSEDFDDYVPVCVALQLDADALLL